MNATQSTKKDFYLHPGIKRAGLQESLTPEQIKEYLKCKSDPEYFCEKYVKIKTTDKGMVPFVLRPYQRKCIRLAKVSKKLVALWGRQQGKTTTFACGYILWFAFFHPDKECVIMANKGDMAREIVSRIYDAYAEIPYFLQPGARSLLKGNLVFDNGSKIRAMAASPRGFSASLLFIDECAHIDNMVELWKAAWPIISSTPDNRVFLASTANGKNMFCKIFTEAESGLNGFTPFKVNWNDVPGRDEKWKEEQISVMGEEAFRQEFDNEFLGATNSLISATCLATLTHYNPTQIKKDDKTDFVRNEFPIIGNSYTTFVDVSKGRLGDYSTITVADTTEYPFRICATWMSNQIPPHELSEFVLPIAKEYNNSFLVVENNSMGGEVAESIKQSGYPNFASTVKDKKRMVLAGPFEHSSVPGVEMTKTVKRMGCSALKSLLESGKIINFTWEQITQISNFVSSGDSFSAAKGFHDDLVMNLVMLGWLTTQQEFVSGRVTNQVETVPEPAIYWQRGGDPSPMALDDSDIIFLYGREYYEKHKAGQIKPRNCIYLDYILPHKYSSG